MKEKGESIIKFADAVAIESPLANSYGLDLTNKDCIGFTFGSLKIEIIGGIEPTITNHLRVTLKIFKLGNQSPTEIYRSSQLDLLNDNQLQKAIKEASERTKIEKIVLTNAIYDLTERLDQYKRAMPNAFELNEPENVYQGNASKKVKSFLKQKNLIAKIKEQIKNAGIVDESLGLQIFILGISRITPNPIHVLLQGKRLQASEFFNQFKKIIPKTQLHEITSLSKKSLSYAPYKNYWEGKSLLLHNSQSLFENKSILKEYIEEGKVNRLVTEFNRISSQYRSREIAINETLQFMSYSAVDFHPLFNTPALIVLPQLNTNKITEQIYLKTIHEHIGLIDNVKVDEAILLLQNIQLAIRYYKVHNPLLDQIDLQPFFKSDVIALRRFLAITDLITLLHQEQCHKIKNGMETIIETTSEHMIQSLELFNCIWLQEDERLYFTVSGTFEHIKRELKKRNPDDYESESFKVNELRPISISPSTFSRHILILEQYNWIKRIGGSNRNGFKYEVVKWQVAGDKIKEYQKLIESLKNLSN